MLLADLTYFHMGLAFPNILVSIINLTRTYFTKDGAIFPARDDPLSPARKQYYFFPHNILLIKLVRTRFGMFMDVHFVLVHKHAKKAITLVTNIFRYNPSNLFAPARLV